MKTVKKIVENSTKKSLKKITKNPIKSKLRKEIRDEFKKASKQPLDFEEFKMYTSQLFLLDKMQNKFKNQRRGWIINKTIKDDSLYPEICKLRRIENSDEGDKTEIAKLIKKALIRQFNKEFENYGNPLRLTMETVEDHVNKLTNTKYDEDRPAQTLEMVETDRLKDVIKYMKKNIPVYQWCKEVKGLGVKLSAKLLAIIGDIQRFPDPASLWSYCGVGDPEKGKRQTGKQLNHSPIMRATLFVLAESFIKSNSQYRIIYDKRKEKTLITHPEWHNLVPCSIKNVGKDAPKTDKKGKQTWANKHPKHAHIDASRVMVKRFLAELFAAWYQSLGLEPPSKPYGVEIQGHHEEPMIVPYIGKRGIIEIEINEDN